MFDLARVPVIATARLVLRRPEERDLAALAAFNADPETMRFLGTGETLDERGSWRQLAMLLGHWALRGYGLFAVEERASGAFVGRTGLLYPAAWPEIELAWGIARPHWGRGYASEAALAVRDWAFGTLGLERVASFIHRENLRSMRVAEKIGSRREGTLRLMGHEVFVYAQARRP